MLAAAHCGAHPRVIKRGAFKTVRNFAHFVHNIDHSSQTVHRAKFAANFARHVEAGLRGAKLSVLVPLAFFMSRCHWGGLGDWRCYGGNWRGGGRGADNVSSVLGRGVWGGEGPDGEAKESTTALGCSRVTLFRCARVVQHFEHGA